MCGIFGYIDKRGDLPAREALESAVDTMYHRGPDGRGSFMQEKVFLGHRRLSIIDLSEKASQPLRSVASDSWITYNGEVYNYKSLRPEVGQMTSDSDTEVVLNMYMKEGPSSFARLRGIFAFCIYNSRDNKIVLCRDRAGVKPLYYFRDGNRIVFGSELKAVLPLVANEVTVNTNILDSFLRIGYCEEPQTIYNEIKALEPGCYLEFDLNSGEVIEEVYGGYDFSKHNHLSFEDNVLKTKEYLKKAVSRNLVSDVPVNIALSGGIDSSLVYALANMEQEVKGINVRMDDIEYDESPVAIEYAEHLGREVQVIATHTDDKLELINKLLLHFDQPFADSSLLPFYYLNKASSGEAKVLIGGDSGDEIHGGYLGHRMLPKLNSMRKWKVGNLTGLLTQLPGAERKRQFRKLKYMTTAPGDDELIYRFHSWLYDSNRSSEILLDANQPTFRNLPDLSFEDKVTWTYFYKRMQSDYLRKSDMMSMLNSVEFRVPMLDEDLVEFSLSVPYKQKISKESQKKILREIHKGIYPPRTSMLKKQGFSIPLDTWFNEVTLEQISSTLKDENGVIRSKINSIYIDSLLEKVKLKKGDERVSRAGIYQQLLMFYALQLWSLNH